MQNIFNSLIFRFVIGVCIGIPFTGISLILGLHGLFIGYGGIVEGNMFFLAIGVITVTGFIGIAGAWARIFSSTEKMSTENRDVIRLMLYCGFISSMGLLGWALYADVRTSVVPILLLICSAFFILATPKNY